MSDSRVNRSRKQARAAKIQARLNLIAERREAQHAIAIREVR